MKNGDRVWAMVIAVIVLLLGIVGWLITREFESIDARLDAIRDYVLQLKNH